MSECSRKDLTLQSVCSPGSPVVSPPDGETQMENFYTNKVIFNSFYVSMQYSSAHFDIMAKFRTIRAI